jgi:hypothetical protein
MDQSPSFKHYNRSASKKKNSPPSMEHDGSLPSSQQPTNGPHPEPDEASPHPPTLFP